MFTIDLQSFILDNLTFLSLILILNFSFLFLIHFSKNLPQSLFKDFIHTPTGETNTLLLGGIGMAFSNILLIYFIHSNNLISTNLKFPVLGYFVGIFILTVQGYLDDKFTFSLNTRVLGFIFMIVTYDVLLNFASPIESLFQFTLHSIFWGLGTLHGSHNLNTKKNLGIKSSFLILTYYFLISYHFKLFYLSYSSLAMLLPVVCFCIFNQFKNNLRLGEIGSNVLALGYLFLSTQVYLNLSKSIGHMYAICVVVIPLSIPTAEIFFEIIFSKVLKSRLSSKNSRRRKYSVIPYALILCPSLLITLTLSDDAKYILALLSCAIMLFIYHFKQREITRRI